jgi:hypothetical protein
MLTPMQHYWAVKMTVIFTGAIRWKITFVTRTSGDTPMAFVERRGLSAA